jgi:autotransporter-associated beta strand protein
MTTTRTSRAAWRRATTIAWLVSLALAPGPAAAQFTWSGNGTDANWSTAANWQGMAAPPSSTATALTFTGANNLSPVNNIANPFDLNSLTFDANAQNFTLSGNTLQFQASGGTQPTVSVFNQFAQAINNPLNLVGNLTVTDGGTLFNSTNLSLGGAIGGGRSLTVGGFVSASLNAVNTYGGGTVLTSALSPTGLQGVFRANVTNALPFNGNVTVKAGTLFINRSTQTVNDLTLSDPQNSSGKPPPVVQLVGVGASAGTLILKGNITYNPPVMTPAPTAFIMSDGGPIDLGATVHTIFVGPNPGSPLNLLISAPIIGTGGIVVSGKGTLALTGANTFTGGTTIGSGGTLKVNSPGTLVGRVTVNGGTLGGTGVIDASTVAGGAVIFNFGGTVSPGNSPGVLTIHGPVTFNAGSSFLAELNGPTPGNGATFHDQLVVTGAGNVITLTGATLSATLGYTPGANDKLFILDNQTGTALVGTFAQGNSITVGGYMAQISYFGNPAGNAIAGGNSVVLYGFIPVPEPALTFAVGLAGLGGWHARRRRARQ